MEPKPPIKHIDKIIAIISMFYPNAKIYLFGSYAYGKVTRSSDVDIAIDAGKEIPILEIAQIRHMIEVLNVLQEVDVVDFKCLPTYLQEKILKDGVVWKG